MRISKAIWVFSLAALPWLRGIPAEAFFRKDGAAETSRGDTESRRDTARDSELDAEGSTDSGTFVFRKYVEEVRVSFSVKGQDGHPIPGVQPQDLQLFENMVPVEQITAFDRNFETPKRMAVLLDNSGSLAKNFAGIKATLVDVLSGVVRPGQDEARIASLNGTGMRWLTPFTDSIEQMRAAVVPLSSSGPTALYDSLIEMTDDQYWHSSDRARAQRVMLLFTDGEDNLSFHTLQDTIEAITGSNYYVCAVVVHPGKKSSEGLKVLQTITAATGGRVFEMQNKQDLQRVLVTINDDLAAQYSIAYRRSPNDRTAGYREISIIPSNPNWTVRSRAGYVAAPRIE